MWPKPMEAAVRERERELLNLEITLTEEAKAIAHLQEERARIQSDCFPHDFGKMGNRPCRRCFHPPNVLEEKDWELLDDPELEPFLTKIDPDLFRNSGTD